MLLTLFYFILAILLLVLVHEYGHFQVARWCGVKVLRFSFGFGKVLASVRDKQGTEYSWSLLPLGGYVKMLGEQDEIVAEHEKQYAFCAKPVLSRILIVLAGPLFNFLFAFVALWLVLVIGSYSFAPIIDAITPGSIAAKAGLSPKQEIIALDSKKINSWSDFQYALMPLIGSKQTIHLTLKSIATTHEETLALPLAEWHVDEKQPDALASLGIQPFVPNIPPIVGEVMPDSPAAKAGLLVGDNIVRVGKRALNDWGYFVEYVRKHPSRTITLTIKRNKQTQKMRLTIGKKTEHGESYGYIGVRSKKIDWPISWLRLQRQGPVEALGSAFMQTVHLTQSTFVLMGRVFSGQLGLGSISGPVGIAKGAGESGRGGVVSYLFFLALISISLGALNLLPIPLLDGGHLMYYLIEIIRGKPLSERVRAAGMYIGLAFVIALMSIALTNDVTRLTS